MPDAVDILALGAHTEKLDGLDRTQFGKAGLQVRQLLTRGFGKHGAHLVVVGFAADDPVNEPAERGLGPRVWGLAFHPLFGPARDFLRGRRVDAWHRVAHTTLMQDHGCRRSPPIPDERDLGVDDVSKELGWALRMERDVELPGQMREQMIGLARYREDGIIIEPIKSGVAVKNDCIHGNLLTYGFAGWTAAG